VRKWDLLAELTDVLLDDVSKDLWLLSVGIDNNPWSQYQGVPGGKVNILGSHSIGHSKQKCLPEQVSYFERFPR